MENLKSIHIYVLWSNKNTLAYILERYSLNTANIQKLGIMLVLIWSLYNLKKGWFNQSMSHTYLM